MITIDQLLESVDLNFEPRWVTQDEDGVTIFADKPKDCENAEQWFATNPTSGFAEYDGLKLAEFENKPWAECIYEVPRKTTGKIEKLTEASIGKDGDVPSLTSTVNVLNIIINRLNQVIDAVNELKGTKNE